MYINNELNTLKTDIQKSISTKKKPVRWGSLQLILTKPFGWQWQDLTLAATPMKMEMILNVVATAPKENYRALDALENLYVNNALGTAIPLKQLASIDFETSPTNINHFNKNRFVKITSSTRKGVLANDVLAEVVPKF